jgi:hypothetical protein
MTADDLKTLVRTIIMETRAAIFFGDDIDEETLARVSAALEREVETAIAALVAPGEQPGEEHVRAIVDAVSAIDNHSTPADLYAVDLAALRVATVARRQLGLPEPLDDVFDSDVLDDVFADMELDQILRTAMALLAQAIVDRRPGTPLAAVLVSITRVVLAPVLRGHKGHTWNLSSIILTSTRRWR